MDNICIAATKRTPEINFDFENGTFEIKGYSMPENSDKFYIGLIERLSEYAANPLPETNFIINLLYYNSSTARSFQGMFQALNKLHVSGKQITVKWLYEEDDPEMRDGAKDFQSLVDFHIEMIPVAV
ncbi:MAG: hypothetical protein COA57_12560 [Flavobacteriales bacterium]|nr:MAG: hypothetical protein COA57_12560 [Flavobacteriales bacterium]